jgi:hypothetical protein
MFKSILFYLLFKVILLCLVVKHNIFSLGVNCNGEIDYLSMQVVLNRVDRYVILKKTYLNKKLESIL